MIGRSGLNLEFSDSSGKEKTGSQWTAHPSSHPQLHPPLQKASSTSGHLNPYVRVPVTVPESCTGAVWPENFGVLCAWSRGRKEECSGEQRLQVCTTLSPADSFWRREVERGPEQGPLNCWGFEQRPHSPRRMGKIKWYNDTQYLWPLFSSESDCLVSLCVRVLFLLVGCSSPFMTRATLQQCWTLGQKTILRYDPVGVFFAVALLLGESFQPEPESFPATKWAVATLKASLCPPFPCPDRRPEQPSINAPQSRGLH